MLKKRQMSSSVRYHRINSNEGDEYVDAQFKPLISKVPYKAIGLAVTLLSLGSILLTIGIMLLTGYIDVKYSDRTWPVMILGLLLFIPGFYHVRLAAYAWKGYKGYSYEDIPDFD